MVQSLLRCRVHVCYIPCTNVLGGILWFSHCYGAAPDSTTPVAQRWATGGSTVGPPVAATGGPTSFWPVGQRWPNSGMPLLGHWWPNVGPPVAPPLGHRWQPPVGQRHFGQWANVGPTVACGMPVGPPVGHRWATSGPTSVPPLGQ